MDRTLLDADARTALVAAHPEWEVSETSMTRTFGCSESSQESSSPEPIS